MIFRKSEILGLHLNVAVRVKVKICQGRSKIQCQKFSLDPQITSFDLLRILLARAFNIKGEFSVSYCLKKDTYIPITSDWDLDVAISEASTPYLQLRVDLLDLDKALDEWDIITPGDIPPPQVEGKTTLAESILSQMGKTVQKLQRALSFDSGPNTVQPEKQPMTPAEFDNFLDSDGRVVRPMELHMSVYQGGIEAQLRPLIWKHLLNVFPEGLNAKEREEYLLRKSDEYYKLRGAWQSLMHENMPEALKSVTTLVRKDVRRTDRIQKFYSGSDDNKNILALFNVLTTYGVNHQCVSYCQGMSDILSPILFVMDNEAHAYICFCGLMKRMEINFRPDGRSMKIKFRHLRMMLRYYDRELFLHLKHQDALDLLFCYRWLVLELKREFRYEDALHMLEVLWGSLPPKPPRGELVLFEVQFPPPECVPEGKSSLTVENLIWIDNHFGQTSEKVRLETELSVKKWSSCVRRQARDVDSEDSSDEEEEAGEEDEEENEEVDEVSKPSKKNRSIHWLMQKLGKISESLPSRDIDTFSCEVGSTGKRQESGICQSWPFITDMAEKQQQSVQNDCNELRRATYPQTDVGHSQWCYSNTLSELQRGNFLTFQRLECEESTCKEEVDDKESLRQRHGSSDSNYGTNSDDSEFTDKTERTESKVKKYRESNTSDYASVGTPSLAEVVDEDYESGDDGGDDSEGSHCFDFVFSDSMYGSNYEEAISYFGRRKQLLPPPHELGDGNPFVLFLCVAMILQQRDIILRRNMEYNELGMHFDKLVRKHCVMKVLHRARTLFAEYLNLGWQEDHHESGDEMEST